MSRFLPLFAVALAFLGSSCALNIKGMCVEGPNKGAAVTAKATYFGTGSGKITAISPWGEPVEGRYTTMAFNGSLGDWQSKAKWKPGEAEAWGNDINIQADGFTQIGTALLLGPQGGAFDVVYWGSSWSPRHGQGKMKDNRGNFYKLVW